MQKPVFPAAKLILQAPMPVFEGDSLVLRCRAQAGLVVHGRTVYKHDEVLRTHSTDSSIHIPGASLKDNGEYHCSVHESDDCSVSSNRVQVQVQGEGWVVSDVGSSAPGPWGDTCRRGWAGTARGPPARCARWAAKCPAQEHPGVHPTGAGRGFPLPPAQLCGHRRVPSL